MAQWYKESTCNVETQVQSLGWEDALEEEMTARSTILAREISRTDEPGGLQCHKRVLATQGQQDNRFYEWKRHCSSSPCKRPSTFSPTCTSSVRYSSVK